ncbi:MAG: amidohydrolase family protein, partial [Methanomassiliicoccales archaeon]
RLFGLHASERIREDIDQVLDLEPDFLVHMNQATDDDLALCAQEEVPVVVCPRSNLFFQRLPPLARMLEAGVEIGLGTDNAMISLPDMIGEMETAGRILRYQGVQKVDSVLEMGISTGRKILKVNEIIGIQPGSWCDFMVVRPKGGEVMTDIVLRSGADDPRLVCIGNNTWRGPGCACSKEY